MLQHTTMLYTYNKDNSHRLDMIYQITLNHSHCKYSCIVYNNYNQVYIWGSTHFGEYFTTANYMENKSAKNK